MKPDRRGPAWVLSVCLGTMACSGATSPLRAELLAADVDVGALFAEPTAAEKAEALTAWAARDRVAVAPEVVDTVEEEGGRRLLVVRHRHPEGHLHYGAVIVPAEPAGPLGVALSLGGYGPPFETAVALTPPRPTAPPLMTVYPSFRGGALVVGGKRFVSGGDRRDQCDGAAEDALTLLDAVRRLLPERFGERWVAVGGSRGGNVALVLDVREPRIAAVASLAGPTTYLEDSGIDHPNLSEIYRQDLLRRLLDGGEGVTEARRRLLACSPAAFAHRLGRVQHHHGTGDRNVPDEAARVLQRAWQRAGRPPGDLEIFFYPEADHQLQSVLPLVAERIDRFMAF